MSITYTPTTNFGSKDSLPSNDPNKVIRGAEFTTEFTAIQSAFGLAAPASNPTFTGTATFDNVTASTVSLGSVTASSLTVNGAFTSPGIDDNATSTAITIDANENVGIGTTSPASYNSAGDNLVVAGSGNAGMSIVSGSSSTGTVYFADGTSGSETYRGFIEYNHTDDKFKIGTAGNGRVYVDASGNVGIGTANPSKQLTLETDTLGAINGLAFSATTTERGSITYQANTGEMNITSGYAGYGGYLTFDCNGSERMRIDTAGNVGIGTTSSGGGNSYLAANNTMLKIKGNSANKAASLQLQSFGTANSTVFEVAALDNSQGVLMGTMTNGTLGFMTNATTKMTITSGGNVGIGNVGSNAKLEVTAASGEVFRADASGGAYRIVATQSGVNLNGNVGIATATPNGKLDVKATSSNERLVRISHPSSPDAAAGYFGFVDSGNGNDTGVTLGVQYAGDYYNAITVDRETQNVGIGTDAPAALLAVNGSSAGELEGLILRNESSAASGQSVSLTFETSSGTSGGTGAQAARIEALRTGFGTTGDLLFHTSDAGNSYERMRINSSGNVGIGTDSPNISAGASGSTALTISASTANNTNRNGLLELRGTRSAAGNVVSYLRTFNNSATTPMTDIQSIRGNTDALGELAFHTSSSEAMRIDASGNLLVGKTSANASIAGAELRATGQINSTLDGDTYQFYNPTDGVYRFYVSSAGVIHATSTSITGISDASLKENVRDLDSGLDTIKALRPRRFDWKNGDGTDVMGFIAQEVEEVMPELVEDHQYSDEEVKKSLRMGDMIPAMVKAMQEQQEMIEALKAEVEALKNA